MEITETRVSPVEKPSGRLKGFASVTFDGVFVVRGIRIIEGDNGLFIAMPNRKTEFRCPGCGGWNVFHAKFCNRCGKEIAMSQPHDKNEDDPKNYHDIVHPINNEFREIIQSHILNEYQSETQGRKTL
ncbi:MAG TPA: SpoVG family protein [bacterium]|uniref:Putative septation protein SpoVG n=1 Tax=candidate division TA06 bacterium ADurb.Bin417 TaxID=1852828 RepID=A0A1V5MHL7_UNCT6|nr:MAG: putative septation protein SpoVG [candidate division TA06 bacterium ADurb.Bin417]HNQ35064.1 SpoVG family protein [bacterium]HNS48433.1 SpoVG family protein [bacterium]